ncbi:MAG TPA: PH domain-containing protein [Micrococcaceae bacterium]
MSTSKNPGTPPGARIFRPRTSAVLAFISWAIAGVMVVFSLLAGIAGLAGVPVALAVAYFGYWLFWFPVVKIDDDAVTLVNPLFTVSVPWSALIFVDTKFALTLITPNRRYTAWAAPASGAIGTFRATRNDASGLPHSSYGAGGSLRPGDLKNSDSGAAAQLVRTRWAALVESGAIDVDQTGTVAIAGRVNWLAIVLALALLVSAAAALG